MSANNSFTLCRIAVNNETVYWYQMLSKNFMKYIKKCFNGYKYFIGHLHAKSAHSCIKYRKRTWNCWRRFYNATKWKQICLTLCQQAESQGGWHIPSPTGYKHFWQYAWNVLHSNLHRMRKVNCNIKGRKIDKERLKAPIATTWWNDCFI